MNNTAEKIALESVVIRFAGDSGDGMQLTGDRFTSESARSGNDLATLPNFPAEIRAPAGSLPGVSSFQIQIGGMTIFTAGDAPDVLVAMNPAALKSNLSDLTPGGLLLCNADSFTSKNLARVGYDSNPLEDSELAERYNLVTVPMTTLTLEAVKEQDLIKSSAEKCKNFFALGIVCWLYGRSLEDTRNWIAQKFAKNAAVLAANQAAMEAGMAFAQASEVFHEPYQVSEAPREQGRYRNITGNTALAYGLIAASELSGRELFYGSYPITPASDVLHEISRHKNFHALTFQAEDEIAACCAAIGASYGGKLAVTASSGPGIALKQEAIGLAATAELPLVIVNVQRAGPSTGMPTKTEQADLLEVLYGRNGECPVAVVAANSPADVFDATIEACRIALQHMLPVFLLSDASIGVGSQLWKVPDASSLPKIELPELPQAADYQPYQRTEDKLTRPWITPGMAGFEHRLGGLEKQEITGNVSYDPDNHHRMVKIRAEKVARVADFLPATEVHGPESGELLVLGWGGTFGSIRTAVNQLQSEGASVAQVHLRHLNPLPKDLGSILQKYDKVLVPEINSGQLRMLLRDKFLLDIQGYNRIGGQPFKVQELVTAIGSVLGNLKEVANG